MRADSLEPQDCSRDTLRDRSGGREIYVTVISKAFYSVSVSFSWLCTNLVPNYAFFWWNNDLTCSREISLPRRLPSQPTKPNSSSLQRRCRAEDSSLPRRQENSLPRRQEPRGSAWNHLPSSLTDTDFELMKQVRSLKLYISADTHPS